MTVNLLDFDAEGLTAWFAQQGEQPFRARQVLRWVPYMVMNVSFPMSS